MTLNKELPALKNGLNESSGFVSESSVKIAERETVKQLSVTPLNSIN